MNAPDIQLRFHSAALAVATLASLLADNTNAAGPYSSKEAWLKAVPTKYQGRPEYAFVTADPGLPNVLLLGGSNSMRYTPGVRDELNGTANVYRAPDNCRSTKQTLANIETYLGDVKWDVIHFNWGMHDLTHLNAAGKAAPPPDGRHQVPLETYRSNLKKLVARLKRTGAQLVWATTMPVGSKSERRGYRRDRDVAAYNAAALDVMKANGAAINDFYALIKPQAEQRLTDGIHADAKGRRILARSAAGAIRDSLPPSGSDPGARRTLISRIGSERATSGNGNKIVTFDDKTHIVWQDSVQKGYFARARTLDRKTGEWSEVYTLGKGRDNHARPTITVDSRGFLHVIIGGHHTGLQYRRSVRPNDASEWTRIEAFGKTTYPLLICGPDDTLYLAGRHDTRWAGMDFYAKPPGQKWEHRGLLVKKQNRFKFYAAYHNAMAWGGGQETLHMSVGFFLGDAKRKNEHNRDPQGLVQAVGYMRSDDAGATWTKADGTPIALPATTDTLDLIEFGERARTANDQPKPGIRHFGLAVDSQNRPYVVYVRHTPEPGGIAMVTPDGKGGWERRPLRKAIAERWPELVAVNCNVSMTRDDVICLTLTLAPLKHPNANWNPGIFGRPAFWLGEEPNIHRIVWLESRDGGKTFSSREVIPHQPDKGTLGPTMERPTGFHGPPAGKLPPLLYFEGLSRYRKPGELIQNDLFFVQP